MAMAMAHPNLRVDETLKAHLAAIAAELPHCAD